MSEVVRLYRYKSLLSGRRAVSAEDLMAALEISRATLKRDMAKLHPLQKRLVQTTEREVSPQRLVHYRDNWYLDAWCHLRDDIRSFSIDAITRFEVLDTTAKELAPKRIDESVGAGYGIFGGAPKAWATLKFTPERARWVAGETWHPNQRSFTEADGSYVLEIPYSDERELMGDLLRWRGCGSVGAGGFAQPDQAGVA